MASTHLIGGTFKVGLQSSKYTLKVIPGDTHTGSEGSETGEPPKKAVGLDSLSPRVLRACAEQLADMYAGIFNLCLTQAIVPRNFKSSIIIPFLKKQTHPP